VPPKKRLQKSHEYLAPVIPQLEQITLRKSSHARIVEIAGDIAVLVSQIDDLELTEGQRSAVLAALGQMFQES
jgi:hypothetical protein